MYANFLKNEFGVHNIVHFHLSILFFILFIYNTVVYILDVKFYFDNGWNFKLTNRFNAHDEDGNLISNRDRIFKYRPLVLVTLLFLCLISGVVSIG